MAHSRVYVHDSIYDQFLTIFKQILFSAQIGDPLAGATQGPLVDGKEQQRVQALVDRAVASLGKDHMHQGGTTLPSADNGAFIVKPTIFTDVKHDVEINTEEIFGPVAVIHRFSKEEDVLALANDTEFGLYGSIWTADIDRALRVTRRLDAGMVGVNCKRRLTQLQM
jgi:aldehyde dehydrogenase (NAD+)